MYIHAHNPPVGGEGTVDEVSEMVDDIELGAAVVSSSKILKQHTLNGPIVPIINASVSSASPSLVVTGVLKYNINDTITLPSLKKNDKKDKPSDWGSSKVVAIYSRPTSRFNFKSYVL